MSLVLKNISIAFSPERQLLANISLALEKNKIYALMGSNGAGKTTLFNVISGFIKPQSGEIELDGKKINRQKPYKINKDGIGRTFQDLRLITKLSVTENIILASQDNPTDKWFNAILPRFFYGKVQRALENKASAIINQFFLTAVRNSLGAEISYGQQKLLAFACCISNNPTVLLLDEPVAGIQPEYRDKIATLIKKLKGQDKIVLLIEHNMDFIEDVADEIIFLTGGVFSKYPDMEALRKDKKIMERYN